MAGSILGNRVLRTEDPELLTVGGTYVYDLGIEGALHAFFVRSTMAHGRIVDIDTAEAVAAPGVVAEVRVTVGDQVETGDVLVVLTVDGDDAGSHG